MVGIRDMGGSVERLRSHLADLKDSRSQSYRVVQAPLLLWGSEPVQIWSWSDRRWSVRWATVGLLALSVLCIFAVGGSVWIRGIRLGNIPGLLVTLLPLVLFGPRYFLMCRSVVAQSRQARSQCPSCGYALQSVTPEADGCSVCPECGHAWRLPFMPQPPPALFADSQ